MVLFPAWRATRIWHVNKKNWLKLIISTATLPLDWVYLNPSTRRWGWRGNCRQPVVIKLNFRLGLWNPLCTRVTCCKASVLRASCGLLQCPVDTLRIGKLLKIYTMSPSLVSPSDACWLPFASFTLKMTYEKKKTSFSGICLEADVMLQNQTQPLSEWVVVMGAFCSCSAL